MTCSSASPHINAMQNMHGCFPSYEEKERERKSEGGRKREIKDLLSPIMSLLIGDAILACFYII